MAGAHQLALRRFGDAEESFRTAYGWAAGEPGAQVEVTEEANLDQLSNAGFVGLARWAAGQADGEALCREACEAFERVVASAEARKNDAQFYLDQLRHVQGQYVSA